MSLDVINGRLDFVSQFVDNPDLRRNLIGLLKRTHDTLRLVQRFSFGRGDADDLLSLAKTINVSKQIQNLLNAHVTAYQSRSQDEKYYVSSIFSIVNLLGQFHFNGPTKLAASILNSIDEDGLSEHHRLEDSKLSDASTAVEGASEDPPNVDSITKSGISNEYSSKTSAEYEPDDGDVWIAKQRYARNLKSKARSYNKAVPAPSCKTCTQN